MTDQKRKKDVVWILADHLVNRNYEDLNPETIEVTKKCLLDTIGVIIAASGIIPECRLLVELIKEGGGKEESTILGFGGRVPAWMAAFANGAMGHCLDYDDLQYEVPVHPSSPVVSASLAIAERLGHVSGKEWITAIALGNDLICRMGLSIHWKMDWNVTTVLGTFGAAAAAGKLLKLNETAMVSALGIALSEAAGTQEMRYSMGNHMGGLRDGYPARGGTLSALMAKQGILGPENCLEGRAGLFNLYFDGVYNRELLVADLGKRFEGVNVGIKAWPTCGTSHVYIDATLRMVTEHDLHPQEIESITLSVGDFAMLHCQPLEERRRPPTTADAKYSLPFSSAVAATKRRVLIGDLTLEGIKDPAVLRMAQKVSPKLDTRFNAEKGEPPGMVEMTTKEGKSFSQRLDVGYGHPHNPISKEDVINKFWDCISYSARPLSKEAAQKVVETIMNLERVQDISSLIRLLS